ncbi:TPR-like protein [Mycena kentingensis (nom. inval.)]|nr:TPR-like protein [Mycena kentingensis (nom. inval.)]
MSQPLTNAEKLDIGKQKKSEADEAFKGGDVKQALISYHSALAYLLGLNKDALGAVAAAPAVESSNGGPPKERTEVDILVENIYANMAQAHLKNGNWRRAQESAEKALSKNENNFKAMFRKAKALSEQGYFERAVKLLEELKKKSTDDKVTTMADGELARLRAEDKVKERENNKKLKGFLSKGKAKADATEELIAPIESAKIEEMPDDA